MDDDLRAALDALLAKQRGAVIYRYLADLSYAEVGELLECSATAARRSAADGIASLRKHFSTGEGLVRVAFSCEDHEAVLARLASDISPRILRTPRRPDEAAHQLDEYFAGKQRAFSVPVDLQLAHGFRRSVLEHLRRIPYGVTQSYAAVARAAGNPSAVRAAASAGSRRDDVLEPSSPHLLSCSCEVRAWSQSRHRISIQRS
jgi:O6-methylguanine-DNA--protein-cysteine methyltransferase